MKRGLFLTVLVIVSTSALPAYEFTLGTQTPSLGGAICGSGSYMNTFKDKIDNSLLLPVLWGEALLVGQAGCFLFSATGIFSLYFEDDELASINTSLGVGIGLGARVFRAWNLTGIEIKLYPLYEFPVIPLAGTARFPWKFAVDVVALTGILSPPLDMPITISMYYRMVFCYSSADSNVQALPWGDIGFTISWYFSNNPKRGIK